MFCFDKQIFNGMLDIQIQITCKI